MVELRNGSKGYGETFPADRTGPDGSATMIAEVADTYLPPLSRFHPASFPDALEAIEQLPMRGPHGPGIPAARAAVEVAMLDAVMRFYGRTLDDVVAWMGLPGFGGPGALDRLRFSGWLVQPDVVNTVRTVCRLYRTGVRDFKMRVGRPNDRERLERVTYVLRRGIARGAVTLGVDAGGAWTKDEAIEWLDDAADLPIAYVEQPVPRDHEEDTLVLRDLFDTSLVLDASVVTVPDAERLVALGLDGGFSIGLCKCGGLMPSLRLAAWTRRARVAVHFAGEVGETSVLARAGLGFLGVCPGVRRAVGCLGSRVLAADIVRRGVRFGWGGRPPRFRSNGVTVAPDPELLERLSACEPAVYKL